MKVKTQLKPTITNEIQRKKLASGVTKNAVSIGTKKLAWIPVELLNIQPYQRGRQKHVVQIAENWDDSKCNVLLVSYDEKEGCFNVMDGQHRAIAARMRGVEYLVCEIFTGLTISDEAKLFVDGNTTSKKLNPFDTYRANQFITGDDETELSKIDKQIGEVCKRYNIAVEKSNARNTLKSVTEARSIIKRSGTEGLEFVINVIMESFWNEFADGFNGDLMCALGKIYAYNPLNKNTIKDRLCGFFRSSNPTELIALGNNNYPNLGRRARLDAILADIINEPVPTPEKKKPTKVTTMKAS